MLQMSQEKLYYWLQMSELKMRESSCKPILLPLPICLFNRQ